MKETVDEKFMRIAIEEAKIALVNGNFPVAAVLVIDGEVIGKKSNLMFQNDDWSSHAESLLLIENSKLIKSKLKHNHPQIVLYSTLEPCLMCLGTSVIHGVSKIVYACPDPHGGATKLRPNLMTNWYKDKWPVIIGGIYKEKVFDLMIEFFEKQSDDNWNSSVKLFRDMRNKWDLKYYHNILTQ